jgi:CRISP-associated protein Cas1
MKRSYYIFTPGKLMRKQNTLFFHPYRDTNTEPVQQKESNGMELLAETGEFDIELETNDKRVIPVDDVDSLMIFSEINFNARFLDFLTRNNIPSHLFNYYGHYNGTYYPRDYLLSGYLLVEQVTHYKHPSRRIKLGKRMIQGASSNMLRNLKYYHDRAADLLGYIQKIESFQEAIEQASDIGELMGIEGNIRKVYYASFSEVLGEKYDFDLRVRNPPDNAVNAVISFGNSLV